MTPERLAELTEWVTATGPNQPVNADDDISSDDIVQLLDEIARLRIEQRELKVWWRDDSLLIRHPEGGIQNVGPVTSIQMMGRVLLHMAEKAS